MGFYARRILPRMLQAAMRQDILRPYRERLAARAEGVVLEIGFGGGLNLPHYSRVSLLIGLDPSRELLSLARPAVAGAPFPVELVEGSAEAMPIDSGSVDTVVSAWTLCSVPDVEAALVEIRRVLAPGGRFLFVEHGRSREPGVAKWQDRLTPIWKLAAGGCHLNRPIQTLVERAGLAVEQVQTGYMKGPRVMTYMYEGVGIRIQESGFSRTPEL